jgi:hypothetical protein
MRLLVCILPNVQEQSGIGNILKWNTYKYIPNAFFAILCTSLFYCPFI